VPTLPFIKTAQLREKGGTIVIDELPMSDPWPTTRAVFDAGAHYDHSAEAHRDYLTELERPNLILEVNDRLFMIVDRQHHDYLPHIVLRLRETRSGG
jgi:hypothetical protein